MQEAGARVARARAISFPIGRGSISPSEPPGKPDRLSQSAQKWPHWQRHNWLCGANLRGQLSEQDRFGIGTFQSGDEKNYTFQSGDEKKGTVVPVILRSW